MQIHFNPLCADDSFSGHGYSVIKTLHTYLLTYLLRPSAIRRYVSYSLNRVRGKSLRVRICILIIAPNPRQRKG